MTGGLVKTKIPNKLEIFKKYPRQQDGKVLTGEGECGFLVAEKTLAGMLGFRVACSVILSPERWFSLAGVRSYSTMVIKNYIDQERSWHR
jgi:hypothetical protein